MKLPYSTYLLALTARTNALPTKDSSLHQTPSLAWAPCDLEGLNYTLVQVPIDCAKLAVPLDYTDPNSEELELQLIKVNATKEPFAGSVLFNPGGPGASGVQDLAEKGHVYNEILGGQHDLIGFDPRGTGRTIPFSCALNWTEEWTARDSDLQTRDSLLRQDLIDVLESQGWDDITYASTNCYEANKKTGRFLSTAFVARDMLKIVDALGEDRKLRFWGGSYGTLLGQTFAAMFPERVDRMLLDSVVEGPDYMAGYWLPALQDTDTSLEAFFASCISAGPALCPLANLTGPNTTPATLVSSLNTALQSLLDDPKPAGGFASQVRIPGPATNLYHGLKGMLFAMLYHASRYPEASAVLYLAMTQDWETLQAVGDVLTQAATAAAETVPYHLGTDAFWGIACSESSFRATKSQDMHWLVQEQEAVSGFADAFTGSTWPCAQWHPEMTAAEHYSGSFGSEDNKIKTNFPILFVNGRYDPCTPLSSAYNASKGFEGSVVLVHGGQGHKFTRHPSICTAKAVRAYFVEGTMPEEGTFCEADLNAFEVLGAGGEGASSLDPRNIEDEGDRRLLSLMLEYARLDRVAGWEI